MMEDETKSLKAKAAKGTMWALLEQVCQQGLTFILSIVLAHLLPPTDHGRIALVLIFITVGSILVSSGLGQALVQKKDIDDLDFTMVFYLSLAVSSLLYVLLFFSAPAIASFYQDPSLCPILRVLAVILVFSTINSVQSAAMTRAMRFDILFWITLATALTALIVGVVLALLGFGVWSLVWSTVLANAMGVVVRWFLLRWRPLFAFDVSRLKPLFCFGWKLAASTLVNTSLRNLYGVLIGRLYSPADLAFVNKGRNLPDLMKASLCSAFMQTGFSALSRMQDERDRMREALRRLVLMNVFIVLPAVMMLGLVAQDFVLLLYGRQWTICALYLRFFCLGAAFAVLEDVIGVSALARGRSDLALKISIVRMALSLVILFVFLPYGVLPWILASVFIYGPVSLLIDLGLARCMVGYRLKMVVRDVLPTALLFSVVCVPVWAVTLLFPSESNVWFLLARLVAQFALASILFLGGAVLFRLRAMQEVSLFLSPKIEAHFPAWARVRHYLTRNSRE